MSGPKQPGEAGGTPGLMARLRDPAQGRLILTGAILAACQFLVQWPLGGQAAESNMRLGELRRKAALIRDIVRLRSEGRLLEKHLPPAPPKGAKGGDAGPGGEWARHLLAGLRTLPVKLVTLEADKPRGAGPLKVAVLRVALEGAFADLNDALRLIEGDPRLARIDRIQFEALPDGKAVTLQITVLGVMNG